MSIAMRPLSKRCRKVRLLRNVFDISHVLDVYAQAELLRHFIPRRIANLPNRRSDSSLWRRFAATNTCKFDLR